MAITINVNLDEILQALKDDLDFTGNADKYIKVNATADGFEFAAVSGGGGGTWGSITGTLSDQTDLQSALDLKANLAGASFTGDVSVTTSGSGDTLQLINSGSGTTLNITNSGSGDFLTIDSTKLVIDNGGDVSIGTATASARFHVLTGSTSKVGAIIQAAAGQTANLQEWKDSAGNVLASIGSAGKLSIGSTGGLRYTPVATRYTDYGGLNLGGGIYLSFPSTGSDSFAFLVGGSATSNIYMYCNAAGNINTRGSILLGAADGAATLAGAVSSAQLEVRSTTKGFLPPRMTGAQVEAISSPAEGLMAYATSAGTGDVTAAGWWGYNGSNWVSL